MVNTTREDIALMGHLFCRAGFGATYEELERYAAMGYEATVELVPQSLKPHEYRRTDKVYYY